MDSAHLPDIDQSYARPRTIDEALSLLAIGGWTVLAGGTDFFPGLRDRPVTAPILDITAIDGLRGIRCDGAYWRIGALTRWSDIIAADLPPAFQALQQAAREVGSVQIQNRATVAGNLCNASPAADGVPPLLALDAEIVVTSDAGSRRLALDAFVLGNRKTALAPGEIVTEVLVPKSASRGVSSFVKLGIRRYLVISIAMVAARIAADAQGRITAAAISVGACSAVARRLPCLEDRLIGQPATPATLALVTAGDVAGLSPIDDTRAPAAYRLEAAAELIRRALGVCLAGLPSGLPTDAPSGESDR
ncbi:MAG: xanthine dehydrogenase family protein subunit M [Proteobacteria bacterium]|nr:xanthine dehydrogenase family protein subunit M [Pseudomonadota bacterium]MDA1308010.1 xanthine dehydrogenase family protein subunit M [Pseudomonadota bacterium]